MKGEVRVEQILADDAVFEPGRPVTLVMARQALAGGIESAGRQTEIQAFRRQHGRCIAKFRGIDSISEAEKYIGAEIKIPKAALPALKAGWFYTFHLKGCQVFTAQGEYIGIVTEVIDPGGTEILKVDHDNREMLIPFAEAFLRHINVDERRIEVDLPEELRNLNK